MCQLEQLVGANQNALGKPDSAKFLKVEDKYMIRYEGDGERSVGTLWTKEEYKSVHVPVLVIESQTIPY